MQRNTRGFSWLLSVFSSVLGQPALAADEPTSQTLYPAGSQQSFTGPEAYFTGEVQVDVLFPANETAHYSGAYVTFQPSARTAWHLHPAGQHMIVTSGVALTGTRDGQVIAFEEGETVWCPAGIDHWHVLPSRSAKQQATISQETIMTDHISDKVVVITGASSGMGEATARNLASKGAKVVLGARRTDRLDAIVQDITEAGGQASAVATDVTKREDVQKLVDTAKETYGRVDVLFNNAGLMPLSPLESLRIDEWDRMIDVNEILFRPTVQPV